MLRLLHIALTPREADTVADLLEQEADGIEEEERWAGTKYAETRCRYLRAIAAKMREGRNER